MNFFGFFRSDCKGIKFTRKNGIHTQNIRPLLPRNGGFVPGFSYFCSGSAPQKPIPDPGSDCLARAPTVTGSSPGTGPAQNKKKKTMEIKSRFDHFNINVTDLDRSLEFYDRALGLKEISRKKAADGSYELVFIGDGESPFKLELTWLRDHAATPYELGENESHLCLRVAGDYDAIREYHRAMGCVCFENHDMGLYFINDPDDYWIEVLPLKK